MSKSIEKCKKTNEGNMFHEKELEEAGGDAETFSMPGQELYVIELDPAAIAEAKQLIQGGLCNFHGKC